VDIHGHATFAAFSLEGQWKERLERATGKVEWKERMEEPNGNGVMLCRELTL
jgi:hypothetical protein